MCLPRFSFFFNDTATTEIYTLSLHDALPIFTLFRTVECEPRRDTPGYVQQPDDGGLALSPDGKRVAISQRDPTSDRKSTRLNSSHSQISYAVFCLKKKKKQTESYINHLIVTI